MKKICCMLLAMVFFAMGLSACAESTEADERKTFDYTVFEGMDGFSIDQFDKTWEYRKIVSGKSLKIQLSIVGNFDKEVNYLNLYVVDRSNNMPEKVQFLLDDKVYTFDLSDMLSAAGASAIILSENNCQLFEEFAKADELSLRATIDGEKIDETFSGEDLQACQTMVKEFLDQGGVDCYSQESKESLEMLENAHYQDMTID